MIKKQISFLIDPKWTIWELDDEVLSWNRALIDFSAEHSKKRICYFDNCISHQNCNCWHAM